MSNAFFTKRSVLLFFLVSFTLISANFTIYRTTVFGPVPPGAVIGSLMDFLIILPLMAYFMLIRNRYSFKYLGYVLLAAFGMVYYIIPSSYLSQFKLIPYLLIASETIFLFFELYLLFQFVKYIPKIYRELRTFKQNSLFLFHLRNSIEKHLPEYKMANVLITEIGIWYYALFSWKKKSVMDDGHSFSYHKKKSTFAVYIMLIHAVAIESVGFHYLLHSWNAFASYILLFLNGYAILFFLAELHAIRLTPFLLTDESLLLQTGLSKSVNIPLQQIKEIRRYVGAEKFTRLERKTLHDARVPDFIQEKPMFEILLYQPIKVQLMYGFTREVTRIVLDVDDAERFYQILQEQVKKLD